MSTLPLPKARTASILTLGVVAGITITARQPRRCADSATPCAWLPADAQITPRARSCTLSPDILLYAPRSLKLNTGWVSSRLSSTRLCSRRDRLRAGSSADSMATS
jgi:hypothetical protein